MEEVRDYPVGYVRDYFWLLVVVDWVTVLSLLTMGDGLALTLLGSSDEVPKAISSVA